MSIYSLVIHVIMHLRVCIYVHASSMCQHITLNFIGLQVEVQQSCWNYGDCGQIVVREVQLHQGGMIKDLWVDSVALQATVAET